MIFLQEATTVDVIVGDDGEINVIYNVKDDLDQSKRIVNQRK